MAGDSLLRSPPCLEQQRVVTQLPPMVVEHTDIFERALHFSEGHWVRLWSAARPPQAILGFPASRGHVNHVTQPA